MQAQSAMTRLRGRGRLRVWPETKRSRWPAQSRPATRTPCRRALNLDSSTSAMSVVHPRPTVTVTTRPLWRLRIAHELPRHLLYALATMGLLASGRYAVDPPRPTLPAALLRRPSTPDL